MHDVIVLQGAEAFSTCLITPDLIQGPASFQRSKKKKRDPGSGPG